MNPRLRRLEADQARMTACFANHPFIRILQTEGTPPEKYVLEFRVMGLVPQGEDSGIPGRAHQAEILLTLDYPRRPPLCRMLTPVFHPNIDPQKICIGDHWSAGQNLPQLAVRIAEMIAYQSYNVKSPLNARAAAWAEQHPEQLPLEKADFGVGL
jgi:ubiquitin-protein ligase